MKKLIKLIHIFVLSKIFPDIDILLDLECYDFFNDQNLYHEKIVLPIQCCLT